MNTSHDDTLVCTVNGIDIYQTPSFRYYSRKGLALSDEFRELEDAINDAKESH